jgi:hypothetical protein
MEFVLYLVLAFWSSPPPAHVPVHGLCFINPSLAKCPNQ